MNSKHPVVSVPDVGSMDHAWDVLGPWEVDLELLERNDRVPGELAFNSWDEAELRLDEERASVMGVPAIVRLERDSEGVGRLVRAAAGRLRRRLPAAVRAESPGKGHVQCRRRHDLLRSDRRVPRRPELGQPARPRELSRSDEPGQRSAAARASFMPPRRVLSRGR